MINDAGKHEVKKVLRDRCNGVGLVPLAGVPLATFANPRSMFWRARRIPRDTGDLDDSSAVFGFELPKCDRGSTALAGQIGFSGIAGVGARWSRLHRRRGSRLAAVRKPQPVLDQDVLDKDINALNGTTDVETEN